MIDRKPRLCHSQTIETLFPSMYARIDDPFSTVFQSYEDDGRMVMTDCALSEVGFFAVCTGLHCMGYGKKL